MKRCIYFGTLFCCSLFASCAQTHQSDYAVIDLVNHKQLATEQIALSDISESIQLIPLETNDSVLVGRISGIKLEGDKLYIHASNGLFVFNKNGKFLNTIGSKGRGPKEYLYLSEVFPKNDIVWLVDDTGKRVLKYADSGTFLEGFDFIKKHRFMNYYHSEGDTFIAFLPDLGQTNTDIMLAFFNATGLIDSVLYRNPAPEGSTMVMMYNEITFINYGSQIKCKYMFNDTIYQIRNNQLYPDMVLSLGAGKANEKARIEAVVGGLEFDPYKGMDVIRLWGESDRYLYFKVYINMEKNLLFWDKKEQKAHKWSFILPNDKRLDPDQLEKFIPIDIDKNGNLVGEAAPANADDNQVIVVAKLKR